MRIMNTTTITLNIENLLGDDPAPLYERYRGQNNAQPAYVELDEDGEVSAYSSGEVGNGVPMRVWNRRSLRCPVPASIKGSALASLLQGEALPLLERIHAGHSVEWDGSNRVGLLDSDAVIARDHLDALFDSLDEDADCVSVWDVGDWLFTGCSLRDHWADQSLKEAVEALESMAERDGVYLDGYIRTCLLRQAEAEFDEDGDDRLTATHLAELVADGRITQAQADARNK